MILDASDRSRDWSSLLTAVVMSILSFLLYLYTLAPGITWAHFGADGGELIAAAIVDGVPHPPGYPFYMIVLRAWLSMGQNVFPNAELAWLGNLFSAFCAAASVGVTTIVGAHLLKMTAASDIDHEQKGLVTARSVPPVWMWSAIIGLAWATAPLMWKQAIITEVYALHTLLIALLGWALFVKRGRLLFITLPIAFGIAHHLTFVLLLPGVLYWLWHVEQSRSASSGSSSAFMNLVRAGLKLLPALVIGLLLYIRIPWVAADGPPINWGYPDNWTGFWWLISAEAYRSYLFGVPASSVFDRIAAWAYNLTSQFTPLGLGLALVGLSKVDRVAPAVRNWGLLWLLPISAYAISYYTKDSAIYLLPCMWLLAIWLGLGLVEGIEWVMSFRGSSSKGADEQDGKDPQRSRALGPVAAMFDRFPQPLLPLCIGFLLAVLAFYRLPDVSLRSDSEAQTFLNESERYLREEDMLNDSIIVSSADNETFALWYGVWGSGQLTDQELADSESSTESATAAEPYLINGALLQFPWYQRQIQEQYPDLPGAGQPVQILIQKNKNLRPIFFSEKEQIFVGPDFLESAGPLWRYREN